MSKERLDQLLGFLNAGSDDPFIRYAIATEYRKSGQVQEALQFYRGLVEQNPDYVGTYYHFGKLLEERGHIQEAVSIYEKGMQVARQQNNMHAFGELQAVYRAAMGEPEDEYEDD